MNEHWTRWIHASLSRHFKDFAKKASLVLWVEAEDVTQDKANAADRIEVRWDGPQIYQRTRNQWTLDIELNVLITSTTGRTDAYAHKKVVGKIATAFTDIPVFRKGDLTAIDDNSLLGCLKHRTDEDRDAVVISYFGKVEAATSIEQSTVEGHYRMTLRTQENVA